MTIRINDIRSLHAYVLGVMGRATCHAQNVAAIIPPMVGEIVQTARPDSLEVKQHSGKMANILWFVSKRTGQRYALAYNHQTRQVEIRDRTRNGRALHAFDDAVPNVHALIAQTFAGL